MIRILFKLALCCFFLFTGLFCAGKPPKQEYNLADAAIQAAQDAKASEFVPGVWHSADQAYQKALRLYEDREYDEARKYFLKAIKLAEKAENLTLLKKMKSGEVDP